MQVQVVANLVPKIINLVLTNRNQTKQQEPKPKENYYHK